MGNCFKKTSASIHPEIPLRSAQIKVRMKAADLEQLFSEATDDDEVGKLILDGCLEGRWQFRSLSDSDRSQTDGIYTRTRVTYR
jgi:1,4-dihydroxy-2-naphthoyl-CoA synthase